MTPAQFWAIEQGNQQNRQEFMQGQQQQLMQGLGQLAGAYAENKQMKNDAKIYGELLKFAGPAIGDTKGDLLANYKQMDEREQANFGRTLFGGGLFPTMAQSYNFGVGSGIRQNAPLVNAGLKNAANIAGGNATYTPPAGMAPVEPPLPTGGPAPVDVAPAPVASGIPGGQASIDAINADRKRRGLPPIQ
jgi:hypothetical protein